ncbi:MAG: hypothetical protein GY771_11165 [bacterium]|nr:hypothetical protein [bacterium]
MKWFTLLLLPVLAFAAKGELVDNLASGSDPFGYDYGFFFIYWVAFDYDPDDMCVVDEVKLDWVNLGSGRGDMNFAIYLEDFDDPPIFTFTIPEEDYTEDDSGLHYGGYIVSRGDIPLGDDAFEVTSGNKYWIALQIDSSDVVVAVLWMSIIGEHAWKYYGEWDTYETGECSYALYGEVNGIEGASLGEIKALFK